MNNQTLYVCLQQQKEYNMVKTLKKVSKQLDKASRLHKRQSEIVKKYVKQTEKKKRPKSRNRKKA